MTERFGFRVEHKHPGLVTSDYGVHEIEATVCGVQNIQIHTCDHTTKEILLIGDSVKKIKTLVFSIITDMLKTVPVEDFQRCYQKWEQCLHLYVTAQGNYFEGDDIDV